MKPLTAAVLTILCAIMVLAAFCGTTIAITGNFGADSTPYVCVVVLFADAARTQPLGLSTGVLVSPTVVLTAGHSVLGGAAASVCFDQGPLSYIIDQTGKITYSTNQPIYNGAPIAYPLYALSVAAGAKPSSVLQTSDIGIIVLDTPVAEVGSYAQLPVVGLADTLAVNSNLQAIGYGVQEQRSPRGHGVDTWVGTITRNSGTVQLLSTSFQGSSSYLKCTANAAQGKCGIAFGDSGGPLLCSVDGETVVLAINAYVGNENCAGVSYHARLDLPTLQSWINGYL